MKDASGPFLDRRRFLGASAVATAAVTTGGAAHAGEYSYTKTLLPTQRELHVLNRLTYGFTTRDLLALRDAGGPAAWITGQLSPASIGEAPQVEESISWWACLTLSHHEIASRHKSEVEQGWVAMANYARWVLFRRMESRRQLLERMVEVWEDHLYVPKHDDGVFPYRIQYGHEIRRLALASFEELLLATIVHPAMGVSLDNNRSQKKNINENLGRELLEIHTVGQGNYTEEDVKNSARILTGYRVDTWSTWDVKYDATWHYTGPVKVMDFSHPNSESDGRAVTEAYLKYLANHPSTAARIARKLALRFVSDAPSEGLLTRLAEVYLENKTQIKPVLEELFAHDEFWASQDKKVKSPTDEAVSMYRALGTQFLKPASGESGINSSLWISSNLGLGPFDWPRPDGVPLVNDAWTNPSRFLASWDIHWGAAGGWWPSKETQWVSRESRLPEEGITFGQFVDSLSRDLLGREATPALLDAAAQATATALSSKVLKTSPVVRWNLPTVIALVLNQPTFYLR